MVNVLIMAIGSPLGQSILKAVQKSSIPVNVHVADISSDAAGFYMGNVTPVIFPLLREPDYFDRLVQYLEKNRISIIFPTIAAEHDFFAARSDYFKQRGIHIITCEQEVFRICNDKYLSMQFLRTKGINAPDTVLCSKENIVEQFITRNSFPVILKPRFGASSNNVFVVHNIERLRGILKAFDDDYFVLQKFLADPSDYTIGVFVSQDRSYQDTFIIRRNLKFGLSYSGEVIEDNVISKHCLDIANALQSTYSINVQLKVVDNVPYTYEINPRHSSTTSVRAHFGFNEPDMIIRDLLGKTPLNVGVIAKQGRFMRYWEEVYLEKV